MRTAALPTPRLRWPAVPFDYLSLADRSWPLLRRATALHTTLYRASRGMIGERLAGVGPILLLEHLGAKSGKLRTTPLIYARDGDNYVLVASKGGHPRNPAWFHNLLAHPHAAIQVGRKRLAVRARLAEPKERKRLWELACSVYPTYEAYRKRTDREIPIILLEPI
jgi:deazaflavin-dependent oxidoreductase (nitroreductase family)